MNVISSVNLLYSFLNALFNCFCHRVSLLTNYLLLRPVLIVHSLIKLLGEKLFFFFVIYQKSYFFVPYKGCKLLFDAHQKRFVGLILEETAYHGNQLNPLLCLLLGFLHCDVFLEPNLDFHGQKPKYGLIYLREMLMLLLFPLL